MNILSISLLLWQTTMLRCTVWFLEASRVSLRPESRGLQKQPSGMGFADGDRRNLAEPSAQDPWAPATAIEVETQSRVLH
ncbi:MAG TPA: hypothetical protein VNZ04_14355 [Trinickia sp.]|nr:hypothetical protein [Trinickia sp.]